MAEPSKETFDAIVVGSGASGGWACKRLTEAGLKVALVDAGRPLARREFQEHRPAFELPYRNRSEELVKDASRPAALLRRVQLPVVRQRPRGAVHHGAGHDVHVGGSHARDGGPHGGVGTTVATASAISTSRPRPSTASATTGRSSYDELAPYYDLVEDYVGISGQAEGLYELPDGRFLPPMAMTCAEKHLRSRVKERFGRTVTIGRTAVLTRPHNGRAACHYCGPCFRGCSTHSYFNSAVTTVADALATGSAR